MRGMNDKTTVVRSSSAVTVPCLTSEKVISLIMKLEHLNLFKYRPYTSNSSEKIEKQGHDEGQWKFIVLYEVGLLWDVKYVKKL